MKALEEEREKGEIGSSQEAKILLETTDLDRYNFLNEFLQNLAAIFIVSQVKLKKINKLECQAKKEEFGDLMVSILPAEGKKCSRCWNYSKTVGTHKEYPDLCERCLTNFR